VALCHAHVARARSRMAIALEKGVSAVAGGNPPAGRISVTRGR